MKNQEAAIGKDAVQQMYLHSKTPQQQPRKRIVTAHISMTLLVPLLRHS
jgi:hypothetical protein